MGGLIEPTPLGQPKRESNLRPILVGVLVIGVVVGLIVLLSRGSSKGPAARDSYASYLKLSDLKMSQAQNFVGASVTYIDGTVTNTGDKTVIHASVHVEFKNSLDQVAQVEDLPLRVLQTGGPYPDTVDLSTSPLGPGLSKPFRLTFEHVSADWNHAYPELQVTNVTVKSEKAVSSTRSQGRQCWCSLMRKRSRRAVIASQRTRRLARIAQIARRACSG